MTSSNRSRHTMQSEHASPQTALSPLPPHHPVPALTVLPDTRSALPGPGMADITITAASPDAARLIAETLRRQFGGTEQRSYPAGADHSGTCLRLTVDTAAVSTASLAPFSGFPDTGRVPRAAPRYSDEIRVTTSQFTARPRRPNTPVAGTPTEPTS